MTEIQKNVRKVEKPQLNLHKNEKKSIKIAILILILIMFLVFAGLGYYFYQTKKTKSVNLSTKPSSSPIARIQPKKYQLVLKKVSDSEEENIYTFSEVTSSWQIARWQNFLFYGTERYSTKVQLFSHNLDTGETSIIYEEPSSRRYISNIQIINNTLFFSVGGYLAGGATYWLDLPPTGNPQELIEGSNGRVKFMNGQYWLIQVEGDACWGWAKYSLLNINTKSITSIAESRSGCYEGEEYIDIDKRNRMILAFHTPDFEGHEGGGEDGIYTYVVAIQISNPNSKQIIISEENMPEDIKALKYSEEQDKLFLLGKTSYTFNFEDNLIEKVTSIPDEWLSSSISSWEGHTVCLEKYSPKKTTAGINLETNIFDEGIDICKPIATPSPLPYQEAQKEKAEEIIKDLNLPLNYRFVLEEYE